MSTIPLRGVVPVLATPFADDGAVDPASLGRLIDWEVEAGATSVAIFGLASEAFTLSTAERTEILAQTVEATRGTGLAVIAGVTPTSLQSARDQLAQSAAGGARAVMVMPPHLVKPSSQQVIDFFGALSDEAVASGVEIMVQDAPGTTGVQMDVPTLAQCADFAGVTSIKVEAPPTAPKVRRLAERPELAGVDLLGGQNAQFMLEEFASGAIGTMPACEFTDLLVPIVDDWTAGREDAAREAFDRLLPLIVWGLQPGLGWAVHKEVLVARGIIECSAVRAPAAPLPAFSRQLLERVTARLPLTRFTGAVAR